MKLPATLDSIKKSREHGFIAPLRNRLCAIKVAGADATSFLHSQLTNEVKALKPGDGNLSARVTRTGTLVGYFSLHRLIEEPAAFLLVIEGENAARETETLLVDLGKYAVIEDVALTDVSEQFDWIAIQGPNAAQACESVFGSLLDASSEPQSWIDLSEYAVRHFQNTPCEGAFVVARSLTGDPGFIVAIPREAEMADEIIERFHAGELGAKFNPLSPDPLAETLEALRIEARHCPHGHRRRRKQKGRAARNRPGTNTSSATPRAATSGRRSSRASAPTVPLPAGAARADFSNEDAEAVGNTAFVKILEKINARLPEPNAELLLENGTKIGRIASRTFSPVFDAPIAFAFLDRANRTPCGTKLKIRGRDGSILDLPEVRLLLYRAAADTASRVAFRA